MNSKRAQFSSGVQEKRRTKRKVEVTNTEDSLDFIESLQDEWYNYVSLTREYDLLTMSKKKFWCTYCDMSLSLRDVKEQAARSADIFKVICEACDSLYYFKHTNKKFKSNYSPSSSSSSEDDSIDTAPKIVSFDLETTGFYEDDICQIAARNKHNGKGFNAYILPSKPISFQASEKTGLRVIEGKMYLNDRKVETVSERVAFKKFIKFLKKQGDSIILVAHNLSFDAPRILKLAEKLGLTASMQSIVKGFADTLPIFREKLIDRKIEKKSFSLVNLAADYLSADERELMQPHNASSDVEVLNKLLKLIGIGDDAIKEKVISVEALIEKGKVAELQAKSKSSLQRLRNVSDNMKTKMAKADIDLNVLKNAYNKEGEMGISSLLRARVTKTKKIIDNVCENFHSGFALMSDKEYVKYLNEQASKAIDEIIFDSYRSD